MSEITGGELFARCLASEGIEHVFGLPSPEIDPMLASLEANGIRMVPVRHESAGVHMAEGLYKSTGKASAVMGNPSAAASFFVNSLSIPHAEDSTPVPTYGTPAISSMP